jgi:uncharacterized protein YndB with AHSA1/START domain
MTILPESSLDKPVDDLVFECELEAPPQKVWRALTVPAYVAAWLSPGKIEPQPDNGIGFDGKAFGLAGHVDCEVLTSEPPHRLRYAWREHDGGQTLDSIVTFELDAISDGGTHLRIVHGDFVVRPAAANSNEPTMLLCAA